MRASDFFKASAAGGRLAQDEAKTKTFGLGARIAARSRWQCSG